ncbi:type II toxin-antitoxin system VapB family antitoxin [Glycomyces paridis]|uniref:Type II toxin-antitoxin system VapB family antitoxin n=1 Tax=Glycomyces paridis TaxID=2126555 RepID=A0A4S8PV65_9ACTN|nr:type II toxin-antitoxin system VapB family antitoxin [Glycomyces paridis]THV32129.1 type II toxin-antitoxin system VapB family antitoxin [Glycomyces paridis]
MSITQIDLDDEALAKAMALMGTKTKKETVNTALTEYVERMERLKAAEWLFDQGQQGVFDAAEAAHQAAKQAWKDAAE